MEIFVILPTGGTTQFNANKQVCQFKLFRTALRHGYIVELSPQRLVSQSSEGALVRRRFRAYLSRVRVDIALSGKVISLRAVSSRPIVGANDGAIFSGVATNVNVRQTPGTAGVGCVAGV
jgi:hypothetical protein